MNPGTEKLRKKYNEDELDDDFGEASISSKPNIVLSSCTGRNLSDICSADSCLFLYSPKVEISCKVKKKRISPPIYWLWDIPLLITFVNSHKNS